VEGKRLGLHQISLNQRIDLVYLAAVEQNADRPYQSGEMMGGEEFFVVKCEYLQNGKHILFETWFGIIKDSHGVDNVDESG
jgi:hypothetical protein